MSDRSTRHTTFVIERTHHFPPAKVFAAWSTADAKSRWFLGPPERWKLIKREMDFRVGGQEYLSGSFVGGPTSTYKARFQDIVANERIVYSYEMDLDGKRISVSLSTVEFKLIKGSTRMTYTEQAVFLDDFQDNGSRERGTIELLDRLVATL
jgi:uncharacterized protein YndB with AHSA1/START domain